MVLLLKEIESKLYLFCCFENGCVYLWDLISLKLLWEIKLHDQPILCVDFDEISSKGISGSAGNNICVFSVDFQQMKVEKMKEFQVNFAGISDVRIRQDQKIFVSTGWDHRVRVFNLKKLVPLAILKGFTQQLNCVDFCENSNLLAAAGNDQKISVWSIY
eukprot:TRINITY_DN2678_c0_g2_i1.p1 TRINITY_DN2678_c0_g2~~TRINITY_DN2678_c0_g2_i1.p1  ORF type:complete len:160 (+),score=36.86 TRINITY_DN2678_c0_g2_i1:74-553(+)